MKYDYIYDQKSEKKSEEELYSKLDMSLRYAHSNASNYLHKLHKLKEAGEKVNIRNIEDVCISLERLIDKIK